MYAVLKSWGAPGRKDQGKKKKGKLNQAGGGRGDAKNRPKTVGSGRDSSQTEFEGWSGKEQRKKRKGHQENECCRGLLIGPPTQMTRPNW